MPLRPSVRWEVFRRDGFKCAYCGRAAEHDAILTVDHVIPAAAGGSDDPDNLLTACTDCNAGKSDRHPDGSSRKRTRKAAPEPPPRRTRVRRIVVPDRRPVAVGSFCWMPLGIAALAYSLGDSYPATLRGLEAKGFPTPPGLRDNKSAMALVRQEPEALTRWISTAVERAIYDPSSEVVLP